jgi:hypothetical protein
MDPTSLAIPEHPQKRCQAPKAVNWNKTNGLWDAIEFASIRYN